MSVEIMCEGDYVDAFVLEQEFGCQNVKKKSEMNRFFFHILLTSSWQYSVWLQRSFNKLDEVARKLREKRKKRGKTAWKKVVVLLGNRADHGTSCGGDAE